MTQPARLPDFEDLHQTIRDEYRSAMQRHGDTKRSFDAAVARAADMMPLPNGELRRMVARFLAEEPLRS